MAGVAAVATIAGTAYGVKSSLDAARAQDRAAAEAERLGRENAAMIEAETAEQARRVREEQLKTQSLTQARAAASGAKGGSIDIYTEEMVTEQKRQLDWLKQSGESKARLAVMGAQYTAGVGRAQASATRAGAVSTFVSGVGTFASQGEKANWWNTPADKTPKKPGKDK